MSMNLWMNVSDRCGFRLFTFIATIVLGISYQLINAEEEGRARLQLGSKIRASAHDQKRS